MANYKVIIYNAKNEKLARKEFSCRRLETARNVAEDMFLEHEGAFTASCQGLDAGKITHMFFRNTWRNTYHHANAIASYDAMVQREASDEADRMARAGIIDWQGP